MKTVGLHVEKSSAVAVVTVRQGCQIGLFLAKYGKFGLFLRRLAEEIFFGLFFEVFGQKKLFLAFFRGRLLLTIKFKLCLFSVSKVYSGIRICNF